jgi:hypothetical protein
MMVGAPDCLRCPHNSGAPWDFSQLVIWPVRPCLESFFTPKLFDTELNSQVKYLGVILDNKMYWNFHMDIRIRKANIAYWPQNKA